MAFFLDSQNRRFSHFTTSRFLLICVIANIASCIGNPILFHHRSPFDSDEEFRDPHQVSTFRHRFYNNYRDINFPIYDEHGENIPSTSVDLDEFDQGVDDNIPSSRVDLDEFDQGVDDNIPSSRVDLDKFDQGVDDNIPSSQVDLNELVQMGVDDAIPSSPVDFEELVQIAVDDGIPRSPVDFEELVQMAVDDGIPRLPVDFEELVQMTPDRNDKIARYLTKKPEIKFIHFDKFIKIVGQKVDDETIMMHAKYALPLLMRTRVSQILNDDFGLYENYTTFDACINKIQKFVAGEQPVIHSDDECINVVLVIDLPSDVKPQNQQAKEFADKIKKIDTMLFMADLIIFQDKLAHWPSRPQNIEQAAMLSNCYDSISVFIRQLSFDSKPDCVDITAMMDDDDYRMESAVFDELETIQTATKPSDEVDKVEEETPTETTTINEPEQTQSGTEQEIDELEELQPTSVETDEKITVVVIADGLPTSEPDTEPSVVDTDEETTPSDTSIVLELETTQPDTESSLVDVLVDEETSSTETSIPDEPETTQSDTESLLVDVLVDEETNSTETSTSEEPETTQPDTESLLVDVLVDEETSSTEATTSTSEEPETTQPETEPTSIDTDGEPTPTEISMVDDFSTTRLDEVPSYFSFCGVEDETSIETTTTNLLESTQSSTEQEIDEVEEPQPTSASSAEVDTNEEVTVTPTEMVLGIDAIAIPIDNILTFETKDETDEDEGMRLRNSSIWKSFSSTSDDTLNSIISSNNTANEPSRETEEEIEIKVPHFGNDDKIEIEPSTTTSLIDNNSQSSIPEDESNEIYGIPRVDIV